MSFCFIIFTVLSVQLYDNHLFIVIVIVIIFHEYLYKCNENNLIKMKIFRVTDWMMFTEADKVELYTETLCAVVYCRFKKFMGSRAAVSIPCFCILSLKLQYKQ